MTTPTDNPDYFKNGYPNDWNAGYAAGANAQPGVPLTVPPGVYHDAFVNGLQRGMNDVAQAAQNAQIAAQAAAQQAPAPVQQVPAQVFTPPPVPQVQQPVQYTPPAAAAPPVQFTPPVAQQPAAAFAQAFPDPAATPPAQTVQQAASMLDQMAAEIQQPSAAQQAAQAPSVTSAGGFPLLDGIEDELDQGNGESFLFNEVGDQIVGYVRYVTQVRSDYGNKDMVPMLDIEDKDGKLWTVRAYGAAMKNQIEKNDPHVGDGIAIRFTGMVTPKSGNGVPYKDVNVRVRRAG